MKYDKYYKIVENILSHYPKEYSKNYSNNKKSLIINELKPEISWVGGTYNNEQNIINLYKEESLVHELFHMAFNNKNKSEQKIYKDEEIYYSNGLAFKQNKNGKTIKQCVGITEGFCEYMTAKYENKGCTINYFFTDLLISIYGEEILKYPFTNDPMGFLSDKRFYDVFRLCKCLDKIDSNSDIILMMSELKEVYKKSNTENRKKIASILSKSINEYRESIFISFKCIINEYNNCSEPSINRIDFINKLKQFLSNEDYQISFVFDYDSNLKNEITKQIDEFNKVKKLYKQV